VTKQFTAASILLEERGKLSVDDPVKKYLPNAPAAWDKITIIHLLTHTPGIPNLTGFPDYAKLQPFAATNQQLVAPSAPNGSISALRRSGVRAKLEQLVICAARLSDRKNN
jgi:CubicO group peptidase (beta-lactamase class C family)